MAIGEVSRPRTLDYAAAPNSAGKQCFPWPAKRWTRPERPVTGKRLCEASRRPFERPEPHRIARPRGGGPMRTPDVLDRPKKLRHQFAIATGANLSDSEILKRLHARIEKATAGQLDFLDRILAQLQRPATFYRNPQSDLINDCSLQGLGDILRIHHCFSAEAFTKDRFEFALEKVSNDCGIKATRATRGNPGHDLNINGVAFSLKTQADKSIKEGYLHISKFMELGKGTWADKPEQLIGLRDQFFAHMKSYERIVSLRRLPAVGNEYYELVEIPKVLLLEAATGTFEMKIKSKQDGPKPGYCSVFDDKGLLKFQLYFDGGSERKLQIKALDKANCVVHATWKFPVNSEPAAL